MTPSGGPKCSVEPNMDLRALQNDALETLHLFQHGDCKTIFSHPKEKREISKDYVD